MAIHSSLLPEKIYLNNYSGDYKKYIDAVYEVFERDFINHRPVFGGFKLGMKFNPLYQERAYTFYHMTHTGKDEQNRTPDLRRCECMPWGRPSIEKTTIYSLKFWEQKRENKRRVCIWLEITDKDDYFFILDVRKTYVLPWTAFVAEHSHEVRKKEKEYQEWLDSEGGHLYTPDELIRKIMCEIA